MHDDGRQSIYNAISEVSQEVRDYKQTIEEAWREYRRMVSASIGLLSSEQIRMQKIFDQFIAERKEERAADVEAREYYRKKSNRFNWAIVTAIAVLFVVNLLVLVFFIGRAMGG